MPNPRTRTVIPVARTMPDGRLGIVEKTIVSEKRLTAVERRAQASAMMMRRLFGGREASIEGLAKEFDLNKATVTKRLALARNDGVPDEAREVFIREMLPASMAVIQEVLTGDDRKLAFAAAKMVIEGLEAMRAEPTGAGSGDPGVQESFELWRAKFTRHRVDQPSAPAETPADGSGDVIEALPLLEGASVGPDAETAQDPPSTGAGGGEVSTSDGTNVSIPSDGYEVIRVT